MLARDRYHDHVKSARINDGWIMTHDPLNLKWGIKDRSVDLGAEQLLAAEKGNCNIAVEITSLLGSSELDDLEQALGHYILYHDVLAQVEPDREMYLAVHEEIFVDLFEEPIGQLLLTNQRVRLIVFDPQEKEVRQWIPPLATDS